MRDGIVVVGGGFAGFWAALAARRIVGSQARVRLVSREPVLQMRPRLYETAPETLHVEIVPLLERTGIEFVQSEVARLASSGTSIELLTGEQIGYDRLVVATGSRMRRPNVPGADGAFSIDTQAEAIAFDRALAKIAIKATDSRIAIIGAGFTGIELALELRDRLAEHGAQHPERFEILLIDRANEVGHELGRGPRTIIETALADARVKLRLGATITGISRTTVTFDDETSVEADAVVLTTGMVAAPFVQEIQGQHDALGRIIVDEFLRAPICPNAFIAGDAAAADTGDGHLTLQSCQHALQLGRYAGENAARDLLGLPLVRYSQKRYVTCLDLGRSGAVLTEGWNREVRKSGADAKDLKRHINRVVIYPPTNATAEALLALSNITT